MVPALSSAETPDPVMSAPALLGINFNQMVSTVKVKELKPLPQKSTSLFQKSRNRLKKKKIHSEEIRISAIKGGEILKGRHSKFLAFPSEQSQNKIPVFYFSSR